MNEKEIINLIESYFKRKDVGVGVIECISEQKDVIALSKDIYSNITKAYNAGYEEGANAAANNILN